ncbi:hypothetical protein ACQ4PT_024531 [Festuca glaucescens]
MAHDWTSADDHGENLRLPETSSRCITDSVTATHNFEVASYPLLEGIGVGKYVSSSKFSAGGHEWCVRFYPDGATEGCAGNASVYLCYLSQANHVRAKFTLTMLEKQGNVQFVEKSRLKSLWRGGGDGCFIIRCTLTVRNESMPLELPGHLERMLQDGAGANVTFMVGDHEFRAHRSLLAARSPEFRELFFGPTAEKDMPRVIEAVDDMEPTIFEMLLHYV